MCEVDAREGGRGGEPRHRDDAGAAMCEGVRSPIHRPHSRRRMTVVFPTSQGPRQTELLETRKSVRAQSAKVKRCVFVSASRHATTSGQRFVYVFGV